MRVWAWRTLSPTWTGVRSRYAGGQATPSRHALLRLRRILMPCSRPRRTPPPAAAAVPAAAGRLPLKMATLLLHPTPRLVELRRVLLPSRTPRRQLPTDNNRACITDSNRNIDLSYTIDDTPLLASNRRHTLQVLIFECQCIRAPDLWSGAAAFHRSRSATHSHVSLGYPALASAIYNREFELRPTLHFSYICIRIQESDLFFFIHSRKPNRSFANRITLFYSCFMLYIACALHQRVIEQ